MVAVLGQAEGRAARPGRCTAFAGDKTPENGQDLAANAVHVRAAPATLRPLRPRARQESSQVPENTERLRILLSGDLDLVDFDDEDARTAGQVRAALEKAGTPIGAYEVLIAGQALRRELTVVTANTSEFSRVASLSWQDWTN
jgi:hypothetical protein